MENIEINAKVIDSKDYNREIKPFSSSNVAGGKENIFSLDRYFTKEGKSPFLFDMNGNLINWIAEEVRVTNDTGKVIFTQPNVRRPDFWSGLALKVVASKYFWGDQAKNEREDSVEKIISRVARYFERQASLQGYLNEKDASILKDEISAICLSQSAAFNSPVWFNCGTWEYSKEAGGVSAWKWDAATNKIVPAHKGEDKPQCSACFIQSVEDDMDSILALQVAEANLFKAGSGTGSNRSNLRSTKERLTGGGRASGPVSFMRGYDAYAGIIKSGGKTRRAAKMEILNVDHPDIMDFINAKQSEEKKAWALIEQGYSGGMNGEAYSTVAFQNCNMSVRVPDAFMKAVKENGEWQTRFVKTREVCETLKAKEVITKMAEGTWICGDPGMQFDTVINKWHTCKTSGRINASNPCSEYMFLDDSACNLASINLMKFRTENGAFDVEKYRKVVKYFILAQELAVDGSSYPTDKIAKNSHDFRPLGLGYANLGALLMSLGLPYDSEDGRAVAAALTAIMTGEAYKVSAQLASLVGPFPRYKENRESMLDVIRMHRDAVKKIDVEKMPESLRYLVNNAWDSWTEALELGEIYGYRNSQVTVLAPTGTIAFLMDCDTTGIEPDIALVKYKVLSGGGMLKIVNKSVPLALRNLGYSDTEIKDVIDYIDKNDTIEGSIIKAEHLPVFDCAFKANKGKRSIGYKAHVLMMSATQPFLSGAISKTINMPESSTIEDITNAYIYAWEQGLKAVAIYRENSKRSQPLNTQKTENEMVKKVKEIVKVLGERNKMPQTRKSLTHKFDIAGKFEPSGFVRNNGGGALDSEITSIKNASSIVDYVAQFMMNNFGTGAGKIEIKIGELEPVKEEQKSLVDFGNEGLTCPHCGGPAKRLGNCAMVCTSCKQTTRHGCGE